MAKIIYTDGKKEELNDTSFEEFSGKVGGYIITIKLINQRIMIVNEEGEILKLKQNPKATKIFNEEKFQPYRISELGILGNVVICKNKEFK